VPDQPVLTSAQIRVVESLGHDLMQRAGRSVARLAMRLAQDTGGPIVVVAGPGNNGGDAWVAASELLGTFNRVVVFDVTGTAPRAAAALTAREAFVAAGGVITREWPSVQRPALVIDGLLGIGLARPIEAPLEGAIASINGSGSPVLAIDVPSGLDADTGAIRGYAVHATATLTFLAHKPGLLTASGPELCGTIECDDLGLGHAAREKARGTVLDVETVRGWLAPRPRNSHKGAYGTVGVIGGTRGMVGAALLAARAALLSGAGKVQVGLLAPDALAVDPLHPELMLRPVDDVVHADVVVAGPGAGRSPSATTASLFERSVLPALLAGARTLVLDADGLNAIAFSQGLREALANRRGSTILTPHPAEAARLLGVQTADVQADRLAAALALAERCKAHVVLKGQGSVCASPDGAWSINRTGNPGLASGGTGDVLAGMIGAFVAQGLEPARALRFAVCLHGAAADALVARGTGPLGLTASEVALEARRLANAWAGPVQ